MFIKMIAFGQYGIGKTTFLGTAADDPRLWPSLFLDFESGKMVIESKINDIEMADLIAKDAAEKIKPIKGKLDRVNVIKYRDLENVLDALYENNLPYKSLLVDSLTEINYLNLREVTVSNYKKTGKGDGELSQLQDYGRSSVQLRSLLRELRDLKMHVIFAALPKDTKDDMTGIIETKPALVGQLAEEIPGIVDVVMYLRVPKDDSKQREGVFQPTVQIKAKDRSEGGKLGMVQRNPTLPMILDLLGVQASK